MVHRNAEFYSQDIVFLVEDELFKASKHLFVQHSQVFRDMFNVPQPEGIEPDGSSDEQPLILEGIEKRDFIQLLRCLYPQFRRASGDGFSLDQWKSVLKLSNLYGMIEVKDLAVDCMDLLLKAESPSLQIHLAQVYDVPKWLQPAKTRLVERSNPIDDNDVQLIGPTFALEVYALREKALQEKLLQEKALREKSVLEMEEPKREVLNWEMPTSEVRLPKSESAPAKFTLLTLELRSPPGKTNNFQIFPNTKNNLIVTIKEGVKYNFRIKFTVNLPHLICRGLRYIELVTKTGNKVDEWEQMLGSYSSRARPYTLDLASRESPSGLEARSGSYSVRSRVVDDDGGTYDWEWSFKLAKEW